MLSKQAQEACQNHRLYDILYADDTLLLRIGAHNVEELATAIERSGARYGLQLHWGKTQALSIGSAISLKAHNGDEITWGHC